ISLETPFGPPSDSILAGEIQGTPIAFLPRHGRGHIYTPTEVPYRANIYALKSLGVQNIISVSACGSLRENLHPGDIVIPDQLFDFTKDRPRSFFGRDLVAHISTAEPYCPQLSALLADAVEEAGGVIHRGGTYIAIEGPRFSTKAESYAFRAWGMDIIGMTSAPEAFLAREAGMCYATMAHVTDYDVWHASEEAVTVDMIIAQLNANLNIAQHAILNITKHLAGHEEFTCGCDEALKTAIITARESISPEIREKLQLIVGPYL
ncbi:MAG: S-methyl-5'-thioadenosine phosphorylase, partial [Anaerolineae bacterium]|nr:S-methyl-5'-thioadenosine phosphorylase [Anaerolineae bacterium]